MTSKIQGLKNEINGLKKEMVDQEAIINECMNQKQVATREIEEVEALQAQSEELRKKEKGIRNLQKKVGSLVQEATQKNKLKEDKIIVLKSQINQVQQELQILENQRNEIESARRVQQQIKQRNEKVLDMEDQKENRLSGLSQKFNFQLTGNIEFDLNTIAQNIKSTENLKTERESFNEKKKSIQTHIYKLETEIKNQNLNTAILKDQQAQTKILQDFQSALIKSVIQCNQETDICILTTDSKGVCMLCGKKVQMVENQRGILANYISSSALLNQKIPDLVQNASELISYLRNSKIQEELNRSLKRMEEVDVSIKSREQKIAKIEAKNQNLKKLQSEYQDQIVYFQESLAREIKVISQLEKQAKPDQKKLEKIQNEIKAKKEDRNVRESNLQFTEQQLEEGLKKKAKLVVQFEQISKKVQFLDQNSTEELKVKLRVNKSKLTKLTKQTEIEDKKRDEIKLEIQNLNQELAISIESPQKDYKKQQVLSDILQKVKSLKQQYSDFNRPIYQLLEALKQLEEDIKQLQLEIGAKQAECRQLLIKQAQKSQASQEVKLALQYESISSKALEIANQIKKQPEGLKKELVHLKDQEASLSKLVRQVKQELRQIQGNAEIKEEELYALKKYLFSSNKDICACEDVIRFQMELKLKRILQRDLRIKEKALKKAVIQYHDNKLEEVNRSIKEMWASLPNSLKSRDKEVINTVQIVHDADLEEYEGTGTNFNYRVEALYNNAYTVNMRTCSSTGEKQIASLVIRMALAQNLAPQCALFALDEPFASLDRSYTDMLIEAIDRFVETRIESHGIEMQVLLVTHDPHLVQICEQKMQGVSLWVRQDEQLEGCSVIIDSYLKYCEAEQKMERGGLRKKVDKRKTQAKVRKLDFKQNLRVATNQSKYMKQKKEEDSEDDIITKLLEELQQK